jgi:hypothetical protein
MKYSKKETYDSDKEEKNPPMDMAIITARRV